MRETLNIVVSRKKITIYCVFCLDSPIDLCYNHTAKFQKDKEKIKMYQVKKRDGSIVEFNIEKIENAIRKAFDAKNKMYNKNILEMLALRVTAEFAAKIKDEVITVEDILEELVGEIWDETDVVHEPIVKISDDTYITEATQTLNAVFDFIDFDDPDDEEKDGANLQIGEWVYEQFNSIPKDGDSFDYYNLKVTVEEVKHHRILKVRIQVLPKPDEDEEEEK